MNKAYGSIVGGLVLVALLMGCGGGGAEGDTASAPTRETGGRGDDFSPVYARVGDFEITEAYFNKRYETLSPSGRARFSGENWRERFLDELIAETMIYEASISDGFENDPDVQARMEASKNLN